MLLHADMDVQNRPPATPEKIDYSREDRELLVTNHSLKIAGNRSKKRYAISKISEDAM